MGSLLCPCRQAVKVKHRKSRPGDQMSKKSRTNKRKQAQVAKQADVSAAVPNRRAILKMAGGGALGVLALGGAGYAGRGWYLVYAAEHDLTRIGQGKPVVVQVHDPTCTICTALQGEARAALRDFGECDMLYLIADIKQDAGFAFQAKHNVPHVTLVLFDGAGEVQQVVTGMRDSAELRTIFAGHFAAHGAQS